LRGARVASPTMRRLLTVGPAALATAFAMATPQAASAKVVELGGKIPPNQVSCPASCQAITRVTAYQTRAGDIRNPFVIPRAGRLVAFTVRLGVPTPQQVTFFQEESGFGEPRVQLSVLRRGTRRRTRRDHRLLARSEVFDVAPFFGSAPTFVLDRPIKVGRGNIAALTVPTWIPSLAVGLAGNFGWSSSRTSRCKDVSQRAQQTELMSVRVFGCAYSTARMYYTVTYIPDNRPRVKAPT
jgi:hypothetical protein